MNRLRTVHSAAVLACLAAATATAQTSEYFLMTGDQATFHVIQNGVVVRSWGPAPGSDNYQYPIAVAGTLRAMAKDPGDIGAEYDLAGNDLGTRYTNPGGSVGNSWDGTTDGGSNYTIDSTGMVHRFDRNWANPTSLFDAGGTGSLTYDPGSQTLWVSQFSSQTITQYTFSGVTVSSFSTGHTQNMALAMDHADGTLWLHDRTTQGTFEQWTTTGTLLQRIAVAGMSGQNVLGGEMQFPNSATCTFRNGSGVNPADFSCVTQPVLGTSWQTSYNTNASTVATLLALGVGPATGPVVFGGEVLLALSPVPGTLAGTGNLSLPIPSNPALAGATFSSQGYRVDVVGGAAAIVPLNAQDLVLGY